MSRRAIVYARKSLKEDRSEEQSSSVSDQIERCRAYAEEHGWQVVATHHDDGRSGLLDRTKRRGLNAVLSALEAGEADTVVTLWTSRLSRDERQRAEILDVFDALRVDWHAVADGGRVDRSTYAGYLTYGVHTVFDVAYSKRVGENWRRAHERRLAAGLPKSTSPRFGYRYDSAEKKYVVHPAEADVVRDLYRRYTRGDGFTPLVAWLNADGWRVASTGGEWTVRTLSRFLDSGFAAGYISREAKVRDSQKGSHERLLTDDQWQAYRARREKQSALGRKASGAGERWWLAGLVKCGRCGGSTYVDSYKRDKSSVWCSNHRANRASCDGVTMLRAYIEGAVGLWLGGHLQKVEALARTDGRPQADAASTEYGDAVAALDRVTGGLADLEVKDALGDIQPVVYRRAKERLMLEHQKAEERVRAAAEKLNAPKPDPGKIRDGIERGWGADERAALAAVLDRVEVTKEGLTIRPVTGKDAAYTRADLTPRCNVAKCERVHYSRGLCKSHKMRAEKVGILDEVVERTGDDQPVLTEREFNAAIKRAVTLAP